MFQKFFAKKVLEKQLAGVPEEQKEKFISLMEKHPEFFQELALKAQEYEKEGMDRMQAVSKALEEKKEEAQRIFNQ